MGVVYGDPKKKRLKIETFLKNIPAFCGPKKVLPPGDPPTHPPEKPPLKRSLVGRRRLARGPLRPRSRSTQGPAPASAAPGGSPPVPRPPLRISPPKNHYQQHQYSDHLSAIVIRRGGCFSRFGVETETNQDCKIQHGIAKKNPQRAKHIKESTLIFVPSFLDNLRCIPPCPSTPLRHVTVLNKPLSHKARGGVRIQSGGTVGLGALSLNGRRARAPSGPRPLSFRLTTSSLNSGMKRRQVGGRSNLPRKWGHSVGL